VTTIRPATPADVPQIHALICELAEFEREPDAVVATVADLHDALFVGSQTPSGAPAAYALVVDEPARPGSLAAMALYFVNYSTWLGRHGIYLEDLYVRPDARGRGYGRALLTGLAQLAVDRGYGRLEWSVLDWNTPAWDFYAGHGARPLSDWTVHRVSGPDLVALAAQADASTVDEQSEAGTP
jgi:GNAT superfamily N-acetyltransferase